MSSTEIWDGDSVPVDVTMKEERAWIRPLDSRESIHLLFKSSVPPHRPLFHLASAVPANSVSGQGQVQMQAGTHPFVDDREELDGPQRCRNEAADVTAPEVTNYSDRAQTPRLYTLSKVALQLYFSLRPSRNRNRYTARNRSTTGTDLQGGGRWDVGRSVESWR